MRVKARPRVSKVDRMHLYIKLQMHPGYERLNERQRQVIDCFAIGMGYEETGKEMGTKRSAPYSSLINTILPRYKPTIWKQTESLVEALKLIANEVKL